MVRDSPRYVGDHIIRHYRQRTLADLRRDLGHDDQDQTPIEILGGIGRLMMTPEGNTFTPTIPEVVIEPRQPPSDEIILARAEACRGCLYFSEEGDRCWMCGCGGQRQRMSSPWASCPAGKWPA